jgi:hypothetical protein
MIADWRKNLWRMAFAVLFLTCLLAGGTRAQSPDLSTDEAVLAELQKRVDAQRAELGKKGGSRLGARDVCIKRLKESANVIVIGFFAHDLGCRFAGAFINSRHFEKDDVALSKNALAALGWGTANRGQREQLAKLWVERGLLAFFTVPSVKDKDFQNREFHPPQVKAKDNGEIVVTLWIRVPSRMTRERGYQLLEYRFATDGNLAGSSTLENLLL